MNRTAWTVSNLTEADSVDVRALFQEVFKHPLSDPFWRWKYANGRGVAVGARAPDGKLQAHCGGTRRVVYDKGIPILTVQAGDMMVSVHGRKQLSNRGPFGLMTDAFLERHVGKNAEYKICYGFPNERHMLLGERLGIYARMDEMFDLVWRNPVVISSSLLKNIHLIPLTPVDWQEPRTLEQLNRLWGTMRVDLQEYALPQRDAAWWLHRYVNHPEYDYRCFWVMQKSFFRKYPIGMIALRVHGEGHWELMDWVSPENRCITMIEVVKRQAAIEGVQMLTGWFSSQITQRIQAGADTVVPACSLGLNLTGTPEDAKSLAHFYNRWWLTSGDTDFR